MSLIGIKNISANEDFIEPSFNCKKATIEVEKLICSNKDLSLLDKKMSYIYFHYIYVSPFTNNNINKEKRKSQQIIWLKQRNKTNCINNDKNGKIKCLKQIYSDLINTMIKHIKNYLNSNINILKANDKCLSAVREKFMDVESGFRDAIDRQREDALIACNMQAIKNLLEIYYSKENKQIILNKIAANISIYSNIFTDTLQCNSTNNCGYTMLYQEEHHHRFMYIKSVLEAINASIVSAQFSYDQKIKELIELFSKNNKNL